MSLYNCFEKQFGDKVTNGWKAGHRAVDYPTPINFVARAPYAGTYHRMPTQSSRDFPLAAGVWGKLVLDDGREIVFCHLRKHLAKDKARVVKGQALGRTGNSGFVLPKPTVFRPNNGAHMHTYGLLRNGTRWNWTVGASANCIGTVTADSGLNLRVNPNTKSKVILTIPKGKKVVARGFNGVWWKVKYNGKVGWVHAGYLK